jgi:hypothetical protein
MWIRFKMKSVYFLFANRFDVFLYKYFYLLIVDKKNPKRAKSKKYQLITNIAIQTNQMSSNTLFPRVSNW